jgi:hypothetical protein
MSAFREPLTRLLAATPDPPDAEAQPDEVLRRAELMMLKRREALEALGAISSEITDPERLAPETVTMLATLHDRDARWMAALSRAKHLAGERMSGVARLRTRSY